MRIPYTFYLVCYENRLANQGLRTPQKVALDIPIFFNKKEIAYLRLRVWLTLWDFNPPRNTP